MRSKQFVLFVVLKLSFAWRHDLSHVATRIAPIQRGGGNSFDEEEDGHTGSIDDSRETSDEVEKSHLCIGVSAEGPDAPDTSLLQVLNRQPNEEDQSLLNRCVEKRVTKLCISSLIDNGDSINFLRVAVETKRNEYMATLSDKSPLKLIHSMAPKIPAIRHSPDITLKVRATKTDPDPGIAACLIAAAGELVKAIDPRQKAEVCQSILKDRRFEQVCECMMSGIDKAQERQLFDSEDWGADIPLVTDDEEMAMIFDHGLSLRDCCRAAWGLSLICGDNDTIGQVQIAELFFALFRRVCCLLRLQFHRLVTSDMIDNGVSIDVCLSKSCKQLAENALLVLWSFCTVKYHCFELGAFCSCILGLDPLDLRKIYQENNKSLGANDVVDRLAATSDEHDGEDKQRNVLLDWLETNDIVDVVYALTVESSQNITEDDHQVFHEICFDRLLQAILEETSSLNSDSSTQGSVEFGNDLVPQPIPRTAPVQLIDAANLLDIRADTSLRSKMAPIAQSFSVLDLCIVAWSANELNASLRNHLTSRILQVLSKCKQCSLEKLPIWALINAAWAFSRSETDGNDLAFGTDILLVGWIVDEVIRRRELDRMILGDISPHLLSRFVWSIGIVFDRSVDGTRIATRDASDLVRLVLSIASSDCKRFSIEDQARIVWSYMVILGNDLFNESSLSVKQLGTTICGIESSLHRWENGFSQSKEPASMNTTRKPRLRIGRKYFRIPLAEYRYPNRPEHLSLEFPTEDSRLPHLRDLPLSPQMLCQLASACQKSFTGGMGFSETLTRAALRLYTSNALGGRIMSDCSLLDLIRLLEAVASSKLSSGREAIKLDVRAFATLTWALGSLGVKYRPDEAKTDTLAFKKLHLTSPLVVSEADGNFRKLSSRSLFKLVAGIVKTKSVSYFPFIVSRSLEVLTERVLQFDEAQLCSLLQTARSVLLGLKDHKKDDDIASGLWVEIHTMAEAAIYQVASRCEQIVCFAKPSTLCQLVAELIHIAIPSHDLVNAVEREVKHRLAIADKLENATSYEATFDLSVNEEIETKRNSTAPWNKNLLDASLRSFLSSDAGVVLISPFDRETARQLFMKTESLRRLHGSTGHTHCFHSIFELGRCLELVQEYKRLSQF